AQPTNHPRQEPDMPSSYRSTKTTLAMLSAAAAAAAAAALFVAVITGCASGTSTTALPDTPVGHQLAWVIGEVNGSSTSLTDAEVTRHLAPKLLVALPSAQFAQIAQQATTAYTPVRFTAFASQPSATS